MGFRPRDPHGEIRAGILSRIPVLRSQMVGWRPIWWQKGVTWGPLGFRARPAHPAHGTEFYGKSAAADPSTESAKKGPTLEPQQNLIWMKLINQGPKGPKAGSEGAIWDSFRIHFGALGLHLRPLGAVWSHLGAYGSLGHISTGLLVERVVRTWLCFLA